MSTTTVTSTQYTLNLRDVLKSLLMAVLTPIIFIVSDSVNAGSLIFDWHKILIAGLAGGLAYIVKNFFTPSQLVMTDAPKETVQSVKDGATELKVMPK